MAITSRTNQDKQGGSTLNSVQSEQNTITVLRITRKTRGKRAGNTTGNERAQAKRAKHHHGPQNHLQNTSKTYGQYHGQRAGSSQTTTVLRIARKTRGKRVGNTTGNERARPKRQRSSESLAKHQENVRAIPPATSGLDPNEANRAGVRQIASKTCRATSERTDGRILLRAKTIPITKLRACVRAKRNDFPVLGHVCYPLTSDIYR